MGKLKPIGSEKLTGTEKIQRMIEISRYKENVPNSINEDKSIEYSRILPNGINYQIVKEKNGYVIKKSLTENTSNLEYIEPLKNRKYYSSYSQAFKRLNLIVKEINLSLGNKKNISLFEAADEATKYILKFDETNEQENPEVANQAPQQPAPQQPAPAPAAQPAGVEGQEPQPDMTGDDTSTTPDVDQNFEMGGDEVSQDSEEQQSPETQAEEEPLTFKTIQKFTGKLTQKLRDFSANEENQMSSKDIKYVINSVLSALDLNSLSEEDKEQIIGKFESPEQVGDEETGNEEVGYEETGDEEIGNTETDDENAQEMTPQAPEAPQTGEMSEDFDDIFVDYVKNKAIENLQKKYPKTTKFVKKFTGNDDENNNQDDEIGEMMENLFSESKVEKVLEKYFTSDSKKIKNNISTKIRNNSSNIIQEVKAKKMIEKYPKAKFLGKTKNSTLVFEINQTKVGVTKNGRII
jgi:hypothetical protein